MSYLAEQIFDALPALNKKFELEEVSAQLEQAAARAENVIANETVKQLREQGYCPTCGAEE